MNHRTAVIAKQLHLVVGQVEAVGGNDFWPQSGQHAEAVEPFGWAATMLGQAVAYLFLRFGEVDVESGVVALGEEGGAAQAVFVHGVDSVGGHRVANQWVWLWVEGVELVGVAKEVQS